MRVAVGGIFHETNTFASGLTSLDDFRAYQFAEGAALLNYRNTRSELGGFIAGGEERGWDVVPALYAAAVPSGTVEQAAYDHLTSALLERLLANGRPDGVLLALHGAMVTEQDADPDGDLVRRVVAAVGPGVPIVVTVDFHANLSDPTTDGVEAVIAYDTYPHVDMFERGQEAVDVLARALEKGRRRALIHRKLPLLTAPQTQYTAVPPMREIMQRVLDLAADEGVQVSVTPGFPYADVDCAGFSITASGHDRALLSQVVDTLADFVLSLQDRFRFEPLPVGDAVGRAALSSRTPVILVDSADNIGGGSPGDGSVIFAEWLRRELTGLVVTLADPEAVAAALNAGVGRSVRVAIGGKTDDRHGEPVPVDGYVKLLSDGAYRHFGTYNQGFFTRMGRTAVLEVAGNTVIVSERKAMPFERQQLLSLGVDPRHHRALVVKSAVAWRAAYADVAGEVIEVDTPGICTGHLSTLQYSEPRRRMLGIAGHPYEAPHIAG